MHLLCNSKRGRSPSFCSENPTNLCEWVHPTEGHFAWFLGLVPALPSTCTPSTRAAFALATDLYRPQGLGINSAQMLLSISGQGSPRTVVTSGLQISAKQTQDSEFRLVSFYYLHRSEEGECCDGRFTKKIKLI